MQNTTSWQPTKFVQSGGKWRASLDTSELSPASWLVAELVLRKYADALPQYARGTLLDLGCGKVPLWAVYSQFVNETICVDWANSLHGNRFLDHICDLNEPLPFENGRFDTIIFSDVLEHLRRPSEACAEIARTLAPGGHVVMNVPFLYWLHEEPYDYFRYTEFGLRQMLDDAGIDVVVLEPVGGAIEVLTDITSKLLAAVPRLGQPCARLLQRAIARFSLTEPGRRLLAKTGKKLPLGYFVVGRRRSTAL